jgi:hypothetical protein
MMSFQNDNERIAKKAHELWEAEGRPHGRDQIHWDEAKEIIAIEDSEQATLLPATTGAEDPVEEKALTVDNEGDVPGLTDTGGDDLTSTTREPAITAPKSKTMAKKATPAPGTSKTSKATSRRTPAKPRAPKA